jgi:cell division protein FtsB
MQVRTRIPRFAESAVERARLTVVPRRRRAAGRAPFLALVSMVLLAGVVGLLLFNTSMQQASFTTTALEQQADRLAARQQTLEMELEQLRDPQRIAGAAQRLGMVQACSPAFLRLGSGHVMGEPCASTAANALQIRPKAPVKPALLNPPANIVTVEAPAAETTETEAANSSTETERGTRDRAARDGKKKNNR